MIDGGVQALLVNGTTGETATITIEDEQLELLSTNGMLVKRPILETKDKVLVGFKEEQYKELL
jgi:arsenate reductase-like glutaredoxin family protein